MSPIIETSKDKQCLFNAQTDKIYFSQDLILYARIERPERSITLKKPTK
jgi:hypothetical protein